MLMDMFDVKFNDAGLFAVYYGEMIGQFSDGYWENSSSHKNDYKLFGYDNVALVENEITVLPKIRYNIYGFFQYVKKENIECIIKRVLMLYRNGNLVKKAYKEGDYSNLIGVLESSDYVDYFKDVRHQTVIKYFGSIENFKAQIPEINKDSLREFMSVGRKLHNSFQHVRSFWY